MGGRGAKSSLAGVPKNKRKAISNYEKRIIEHKSKIENTRNSNLPEEIKKGRIHHWKMEIKAFQKNIDKIISKKR